MPIGDAKAQVVFHPLAHYNFVGVVVLERELVRAVRPFELNLRNVCEEFSHLGPLFQCFDRGIGRLVILMRLAKGVR